VAVSNLTKVVLEVELGYDTVEIRTQDNLNATYRDVASGELDAFQDVWLPNQKAKLDQVAEEVKRLDPWFLGETKQGMAVPAYMDVRSIPQLDGTDAELILGIEPSSVMMQYVRRSTSFGEEAPEDDSTTPGPARVGVDPARHGDELPVVKVRTEFELQDTGGVDLLGLHARFVRTFLRAARRTARPHYELADALCRRTFTTGGYAGEALVAVGVPIEDHLGVMVVKDVPEGPHFGAIVAPTGSKERVVEVGQRTPRSVVGEVFSQPAPLGGGPVTPTDLLAVAV
jgi:hypothetical protein